MVGAATEFPSRSTSERNERPSDSAFFIIQRARAPDSEGLFRNRRPRWHAGELVMTPTVLARSVMDSLSSSSERCPSNIRNPVKTRRRRADDRGIDEIGVAEAS